LIEIGWENILIVLDDDLLYLQLTSGFYQLSLLTKEKPHAHMFRETGYVFSFMWTDRAASDRVVASAVIDGEYVFPLTETGQVHPDALNWK